MGFLGIVRNLFWAFGLLLGAYITARVGNI